jgi:hypothetical protein
LWFHSRRIFLLSFWSNRISFFYYSSSHKFLEISLIFIKSISYSLAFFSKCCIIWPTSGEHFRK